MDDVKWEALRRSIARRDVLALGLGIAAATMTPSFLFGAQAPATGPTALGRRKLGALEVSALGLGCMSMSGTYNQEIRASLSKITLVGVRTPDSALKDQ